MIDEKQLQEWRKLADEATPGEWEWGAMDAGSLVLFPSASIPDDSILSCSKCSSCFNTEHLCSWPNINDAAFIAAARTAVPALLEEVARLNARVAELEARDDSDKRYARGTRGLRIATKEEADVILLNWITDGFGSYWLRDCPACGAPMQVMAPGFARCSAECYIEDVPDANT